MTDDISTSKLNSRKQTRIPEPILEYLDIEKDDIIAYIKKDNEVLIKRGEVKV